MAASPMFSDNIVDPDQLLQDQADLYSKEMSQSRSAMDYNATVANRGGQLFNGGGPAVLQAQQIQTRMKQILSQANQGADPNEDPLQRNLRTATLMSQGLIDLNPKMAMQAADQAARYQEAISQQKHLSAETGLEQQQTQELADKNALFKNSPQSMLLLKDLGKGANGLPLGYQAVGSYDLKDGDSAAKMSSDMKLAQQNGETLIPSTPDQYLNSRAQVADTNAQARWQSAQMAAQQRQQDAMMKYQNGQMDATTMRYTTRVANAISEGVAATVNLTELPVGASTGFLGIGKAPGESLIHAGVDSLRNELSNEDTKRYNVYAVGLANNLAMIENAGLMPRGTLTNGMERILARENDTGITSLTKLAEIRQVIDRGSQATLTNPKLPDSTRQLILQDLEQLKSAIPFTTADVNALADSKDKQATIQDMIQERMGKESKRTASPDASNPAAAAAPSMRPGMFGVPSFDSEADIPAGFKGRAIVNGVPGVVK